MIGRRDLLLAGAGTTLLGVGRAPAVALAGPPSPGICPTQGDRFVRNPWLPMAGENPFASYASRDRYWLPHPPRLGTALDDFFDAVYDAARFDGGYLEADIVVAALVPAGEASSPFEAAMPGGGRRGRSRNWSGAAVHATDGNLLRHVVGQWTVPNFTRPSDSASRTARASIWIGLDGQGRHRDAALPQIGTVHSRAPGDADFSHGAWVQWWDRRLDSQPLGLPYTIGNLPVAPGETIACSLEAFGPDPNCAGRENEDRIRVFIANLSRGKFVMPFYMFAPAQSLTSQRIPRIGGASAQWIIERPKVFEADPETGDHETLVFPEYDALRFETCGTAAAPDLDAETAAWGDLESARLISMYDRREQAGRTRMLSGPAPNGWANRSLRMRYGGTFDT